MTVHTVTIREMQGGSLGGEYSKRLCYWMCLLWDQGKQNIVEMKDAMVVAYNKMLGKDSYNEHSTWAEIAYNNGWLNTSCPGDACGLHPADFSIERGEGYRFTCHNVDNPMQQITLLAGLAALHDKARKERV